MSDNNQDNNNQDNNNQDNNNQDNNNQDNNNQNNLQTLKINDNFEIYAPNIKIETYKFGSFTFTSKEEYLKFMSTLKYQN